MSIGAVIFVANLKKLILDVDKVMYADLHEAELKHEVEARNRRKIAREQLRNRLKR